MIKLQICWVNWQQIDSHLSPGLKRKLFFKRRFARAAGRETENVADFQDRHVSLYILLAGGGQKNQIPIRHAFFCGSSQFSIPFIF